MSFLTKLLAPKQTAGRLPEQPEPSTNETLAMDRNYWKERCEAAEHDLQCERDSLARVVKRKREISESLSAASTELRFTQDALTTARAEAAANAEDAEKYRRSRANLKQFRKDKAA